MALTHDAWKGLVQLFPTANPHPVHGDYRLEAMAGQVPQLTYWNAAKLGPQPTEQQIAEAIVTYNAAQAAAAQAQAAEDAERTALARLDDQLSGYLALQNPTNAQTLAVVKLLVRAVRYLVRHTS